MSYFSNSLIRLNRKYLNGEIYTVGPLTIKDPFVSGVNQ